MTSFLRFAAAVCLVAFLSGCNTLEPYSRAYTWHPTGANEANLAAMAVNPRDLVQGRGTGPSDGVAAAAAVDRLRHDHVKPLASGGGLMSASPSAAGLTGN